MEEDICFWKRVSKGSIDFLRIAKGEIVGIREDQKFRGYRGCHIVMFESEVWVMPCSVGERRTEREKGLLYNSTVGYLEITWVLNQFVNHGIAEE
jgi:hypothetical protein